MENKIIYFHSQIQKEGMIMPNNAKITILGNLTKDPVTRQAGAATALALSVAVSTMNKAEDGSFISDFYDVTVWGKTGEYLMQKLQKGTQVWVTGDFSTSEYAGKDGQKRVALRISATDVRPVARMKEDGDAAPAARNAGGYRGRGGYQNNYNNNPNAMPF